VPTLVNLYARQIGPNGDFVPFRNVAALTGLEDIAPSDQYRVNGCVVGDTSNCSFVEFQVRPLPLVPLDEFTLTAPEEDQEDPTITIGGNEEEWQEEQ
jgi:hypothetical protein